MCLLEIAAPYFIAWDLRGDSEDGHPAAVTIVESVNQVKISGTATSSTLLMLGTDFPYQQLYHQDATVIARQTAKRRSADVRF